MSGLYLKHFVEQKNAMRKIFKQEPLFDVDALTEENLTELLGDLENELSPENLCCDGELSGQALMKKSRYLNGAKQEAESLLKGFGKIVHQNVKRHGKHM